MKTWRLHETKHFAQEQSQNNLFALNKKKLIVLQHHGGKSVSNSLEPSCKNHTKT